MSPHLAESPQAITRFRGAFVTEMANCERCHLLDPTHRLWYNARTSPPFLMKSHQPTPGIFSDLDSPTAPPAGSSPIPKEPSVSPGRGAGLQGDRLKLFGEIETPEAVKPVEPLDITIGFVRGKIASAQADTIDDTTLASLQSTYRIASDSDLIQEAAQLGATLSRIQALEDQLREREHAKTSSPDRDDAVLEANLPFRESVRVFRDTQLHSARIKTMLFMVQRELQHRKQK